MSGERSDYGTGYQIEPVKSVPAPLPPASQPDGLEECLWAAIQADPATDTPRWEARMANHLAAVVRAHLTQTAPEQPAYDETSAWRDNYDGMFARWVEADTERLALKQRLADAELRIRIFEQDAALAAAEQPDAACYGADIDVNREWAVHDAVTALDEVERRIEEDDVDRVEWGDGTPFINTASALRIVREVRAELTTTPTADQAAPKGGASE